MKATVQAAQKRIDWDPRTLRDSGEPGLASLRAYREYHPSIRVFVVRRNGYYRWLTWKQLQVLRYMDDPHHRGKRLTLRAIAKACHCHYSTVSRMLVRFHMWGLIDYVGLVGRKGGSWLRTLAKKRKWQRSRMSIESRKVERSWLATQQRLYEWRMRIKEKARKALTDRPVQSGYMDATNLAFWG